MVNLIRQLVNALRAAWRRQADLEELSALGDYQLADLGIRREQIFLRGKKRPEDEGAALAQTQASS